MVAVGTKGSSGTGIYGAGSVLKTDTQSGSTRGILRAIRVLRGGGGE
jgi:hypothetical protein